MIAAMPTDPIDALRTVAEWGGPPMLD